MKNRKLLLLILAFCIAIPMTSYAQRSHFTSEKAMVANTEKISPKIDGGNRYDRKISWATFVENYNKMYKLLAEGFEETGLTNSDLSINIDDFNRIEPLDGLNRFRGEVGNVIGEFALYNNERTMSYFGVITAFQITLDEYNKYGKDFATVMMMAMFGANPHLSMNELDDIVNSRLKYKKFVEQSNGEIYVDYGTDRYFLKIDAYPLINLVILEFRVYPQVILL